MYRCQRYYHNCVAPAEGILKIAYRYLFFVQYILHSLCQNAETASRMKSSASLQKPNCSSSQAAIIPDRAGICTAYVLLTLYTELDLGMRLLSCASIYNTTLTTYAGDRKRIGGAKVY